MTQQGRTYGDETDASVICPICGAEMVPGAFHIASTMTSLVAVGLSWQNLWFQPADPSVSEDRRLAVMTPGDDREGAVCPECFTSVLAGPSR